LCVFNSWNPNFGGNHAEKNSLAFDFCIAADRPAGMQCPVNSSTPDTFATLNGLYTASALTVEAGGQGSI